MLPFHTGSYCGWAAISSPALFSVTDSRFIISSTQENVFTFFISDNRIRDSSVTKNKMRRKTRERRIRTDREERRRRSNLRTSTHQQPEEEQQGNYAG